LISRACFIRISPLPAIAPSSSACPLACYPGWPALALCHTNIFN
jgi:hypothetical protein